MFKINTIIFFIFTLFFIGFGSKILSIKKDEHNKFLDMQVYEEISDMDFKLQLIFEQIKEINELKEFSLYIKNQNDPIRVYEFHKKINVLFDIFRSLPLKNYINIGFFNYNTKYFAHSLHEPINNNFFKTYKININKVFYQNNTVINSKNYLFLFKKIKDNNIVWFVYFDLNKSFPLLSNKNLISFELSDKRNHIISKNGILSENPKILSSIKLGIFKYEPSNKINKEDLYISFLLLVVYCFICLIFFFFHKFIRKNILNRITKSLEFKNLKNTNLSDVTLEIDKIIGEKKEIETMYKNYSKSYKNLLLKEYLMGLNTDLTDLNNIFNEFNCPIKLILIPHEIPIEKKKNLYEKMENSIGTIFLNFISGFEIIIIKNSLYEENFSYIIKNIDPMIFISSTYDNLISTKGKWKKLSNNFNKFNIINDQKDINDTITSSEKEKQIKMINYIEQNYRKDISLFDLSEIIGESPKYTSFLFKKYTKVNFKEILTTYRINEAKRMMIENPNIKLKEIYKEIGYNSLISFTNSFKRMEKTTPSLWKEKIKYKKNKNTTE